MRQSNTIWDKQTKERTPKPLTMGQALIQARHILGPAGHVVGSEWPSTTKLVGLWGPLGFVQVAEASTWEEALKKTQDSPEATEWDSQVIDSHNAIAQAVNNLKAKAKEIIQGKLGMLLASKKERKMLKQALTGKGLV